MNVLGFVLVLICFHLADVSSAPVKGYNFNEIIANVPEEKRPEFLRYHLNLGYNLAQESQKYVDEENLPEDFSLSLYNYAKDNHDIKDESVLASLRKIICFEDGTCIDIGDIGIHPMKLKI